MLKGTSKNMKKCEEKWKLKKDVSDAKKELKSVLSSPLNGHRLTKEEREKLKGLRQKVSRCEEEYRNHIENCVVCGSN